MRSTLGMEMLAAGGNFVRRLESSVVALKDFFSRLATSTERLNKRLKSAWMAIRLKEACFSWKSCLFEKWSLQAAVEAAFRYLRWTKNLDAEKISAEFLNRNLHSNFKLKKYGLRCTQLISRFAYFLALQPITDGWNQFGCYLYAGGSDSKTVPSIDEK